MILVTIGSMREAGRTLLAKGGSIAAVSATGQRVVHGVGGRGHVTRADGARGNRQPPRCGLPVEAAFEAGKGEQLVLADGAAEGAAILVVDCFRLHLAGR